MKSSKKLLVSILATASLFGISFANQNSHQVNASMRHYTRYINGNYNAYHNVPGRRNAYLMHYGRNYRNDRVSTYGTYYKFGRHYTKLNRARRWFGYMNVKGLNTRPIRVRVRRHVYRRPIRRAYRKPVRKVRRHRSKNSVPYISQKELLSDNPATERKVDSILRPYKHPKSQNQLYANDEGKYQIKGNGEDSGYLNKQGLKIAEQDTIKGLNKLREAKGIRPLIQDPELQHVAEQRLGQGKLQDPNNPHNDKYTGAGLAGEDEQKDNYYDLLTTDGGENYGNAGTTWLVTPQAVANYENHNWDEGHIRNREDPTYNHVGIAISNSGKAIEDFANVVNN